MTSRPGSDQPEMDPNAQPASDSSSTPGGPAVERIIERFGGIRPMAHKLDTPVTTVQGWKKRGAIPLSRHADLRAAAAKYKITLDEADLEAAIPAEDRHATDDKPAETDTIAASMTASDVPPPAGEPVVEPVPVEAAPDPRPEPPVSEPSVIERRETIHTPPPVVERRSGAGFATAVSLLALLVGAAALTEPWWSPRVPGWPKPPAATTTAVPAAAPVDPGLSAQVRQLNDRLATLEQRPAAASNGSAAASADLSALASRLDALENRPAPAGNGSAAPDLSALTARLDALEKRPAPTPVAAAPSVDPAAVKALSDRIAALESKPAADPQVGPDVTALKQQVSTLAQQATALSQQASAKQDAAAGAQALVLAAGQLRGALSGSGPFQGELQAVKALGSNDAPLNQALDSIAPYAGKGISTQPQLADRLDREASDIVRTANKGEGGNWMKEVTGTLSTLVTVRRQGGDVVGDTAEAVVARAQAALNNGNLKGAVDEMSTLQGPAAQAAAGWLADAKARLAANTAGQQLTGRSIALLTAASGGKVSQ